MGTDNRNKKNENKGNGNHNKTSGNGNGGNRQKNNQRVQKSTPVKQTPPKTTKKPKELTSIAPKKRLNACLIIMDKKKMKNINKAWAQGKLVNDHMRGPVGKHGAIDESLSAYPIFSPVDLAGNSLPDVSKACFENLHTNI